MVNLNEIARRTFECAIKRKKTTPHINHTLDAVSLLQELDEFHMADEKKASGHIPPYTEAQEELADILITCLTELYKRGTNIEAIVTQKIDFNEQRKP